tara:strand:+ start:242 stop:826 length:585 start_codon:yes stop_codon:yes gene_type:complete
MIKLFLTFFMIVGLYAQSKPDQPVEPEKPDIAINFIKSDDKLLLNWSVNTYVGYPIHKGANISMFDENNLIYGLSVGTPIGMQTGLNYSTLNFELIDYNFNNTDTTGNQPSDFDETAFHVGLNSGLFINDLSLNFTIAAGKYQHGTGFLGAINIDLPYWGDFEVRSTFRITAAPIGPDLSSKWIDAGLSLGYEF